LKRLLLRQRETSIPHYYRDFIRASVLRARNRSFASLDDPPRLTQRTQGA
jgi:hypothetical protein